MIIKQLNLLFVDQMNIIYKLQIVSVLASSYSVFFHTRLSTTIKSIHITSELKASEILPRIHSFHQIDSIFNFYIKKTKENLY